MTPRSSFTILEAPSTLSGVTVDADHFLGVIDEVLLSDGPDSTDRLTVEREIFGQQVQRLSRPSTAKERRVDFGSPPTPR